MTIEFQTLYQLSVYYSDSERMQPLAYSLSMSKLEDIAATNNACWIICTDPNRKYLKRYTNEYEYPYFEIREVPLVV